MQQARDVLNPYATLADRTRAALIDGFVWGSWFMSLIFLPWPDEIPGQARFAIWLLPPLIAEPLEVHYRRASVGQALLGLRVEARPGFSFPTLPRLYLRHLSKFLFGGFSLAYVLFAPRNEAIHDRLFKTVVVKRGGLQPDIPIRSEQGSVRRMFAMALWLLIGSVVGSVIFVIAAAIAIPGYLEAPDSRSRVEDAALTVFLGVWEAWILYLGVKGKLPGLRISNPPAA